MGTKSKKSSGSQHNQRGTTQGVTLVAPIEGLPVCVKEDDEGDLRLCVDAALTATIPSVEVQIESDGCGPDGDSMHIVDRDSCDRMVVNPDGSLDTNIEVDAADGDNIAISDGTNTAEVSDDGQLCTRDTIKNVGVNTVVTLGTSAIEAKVGVTAKTGRKVVTIMPLDTRKIWWGFQSNVNSTTGLNGGTLVFKNQLLRIEAEANVPVYIIADGVGKKVAITEA